MGGTGSGNPHAKGQLGNAGGTGRPPKPSHERKRHHISFFVRDDLWDAIQIATLDAGETDYRNFLRRDLTIRLVQEERKYAYPSERSP